ncbi:MAG: PEP-CTERM sorting domain-containing protein [Candidatus Omnitrophota bacterium]|jgi:hypothetical protein|nr:MAG: PEP-CTERM sorting domain-containing protein [Candidatus Omnitrophota bacterium]
MKKLIFVFVLLISLFIFNQADASLWLDATPSIYINSNPDPWFTDSWITGPGDFTLRITNTFTQDDIEDVYLVIALKESTKDGLSIDIDGDGLDDSDFDTSGDHPYITDSHGVFGDDTYFYDYYIGNLAAEEYIEFDISIETEGSPIVHFDAYGYKVKNNGDLLLVDNPNSHDVTWDPPLYIELTNTVPEPATLSLLGLGMMGLLFSRRRKC